MKINTNQLIFTLILIKLASSTWVDSFYDGTAYKEPNAIQSYNLLT